MREIHPRSLLREGIFAGLIGGAVFAALQTLAAAMSGLRPGAPWELSASVLMGGPAMSEVIRGTAFAVGAVIHFGISALYGLALGAIALKLGPARRDSYKFMLTLGALAGVAIWAVNFQVIARLVFPWFLEIGWRGQLLLHAFGFGVPMAYWITLRVRDVEVPNVHRVRHTLQTSSGVEEKDRLREDLRQQRAEKVGS